MNPIVLRQKPLSEPETLTMLAIRRIGVATMPELISELRHQKDVVTGMGPLYRIVRDLRQAGFVDAHSHSRYNMYGRPSTKQCYSLTEAGHQAVWGSVAALFRQYADQEIETGTPIGNHLTVAAAEQKH